MQKIEPKKNSEEAETKKMSAQEKMSTHFFHTSKKKKKGRGLAGRRGISPRGRQKKEHWRALAHVPSTWELGSRVSITERGLPARRPRPRNVSTFSKPKRVSLGASKAIGEINTVPPDRRDKEKKASG